MSPVIHVGLLIMCSGESHLTSNFYWGSFHYLTFALLNFLQSHSFNSAHKCCLFLWFSSCWV